jgi:tetratricopeptide (TPR) repeat protein
MRSRALVVAVSLLAAPAVVLLPLAAAFGDDAPSSSPAHPPSADGGATRRDPDNRTGLAEWMSRCIDGNAKYLAKDIPGAIDMYRQAIQLAPKRPLPHYLLAEAQLGAGNLAEADVALADAEKLSDDRDPNVRGKVLFVIADTLEREKKWDDAKPAWTKYGDYCAKHVDSGLAPATPPARIQAIDDMLKQDKAYDVVRQRIADELRGDAGSTSPKTN